VLAPDTTLRPLLAAQFPRDLGLFPEPASPVAAFSGPKSCTLWQPTKTRIAARFPAISTRKKYATHSAGVSARGSRRFFLRSRRNRRHSIRPSSPRHPCITATSLHLASLSCASDVDAGVSSGAPPPPPSRSSSAVLFLVRRRHLHLYRHCHPSRRLGHLISFVAVVFGSTRVFVDLRANWFLPPVTSWRENLE